MRSLFALLLVLLLLGLVSPAHAAPEGGGSPNAMEFRADTALWSIIVFGGLFVILYFKAWPLVLEGLKKREELIRSSLEEAKHVRVEMVTMKADFQKELADAHQQIPKLMEEARKKGDELAKEKLAEAAAKIQQDQERFRHEMEIAKDQAIKALWEQSAQLATLISTKVIGRSLTEEDHRRLLDEAVEEITHAARN